MLMEDFRLRLTALRGSSSIAIASSAGTISKSAIVVFGGIIASICWGSPTSNIFTPNSSRARSAPATISVGA